MPVYLSNIFTRERSIFYARMWFESDLLSFKRWLRHKVKNSLFKRDAQSGRLSIWYEESEMAERKDKLQKLLLKRPDAFQEMLNIFDEHWTFVGPYVSKIKSAVTIEDVHFYFHHLVEWWSAMKLLFYAADLKDVPIPMKEESIRRRMTMEKYSDQFEQVFISFWQARYPQYRDFAPVVDPKEIFNLGDAEPTTRLLAKFRIRLETGCALFNGRMYSISELANALVAGNVELVKTETKDIEEIRGNVACKGMARGRVRLVLLKKDTQSAIEGEILVSTMTTPDFVPAMKRAAAIITDEGGITCHAAIISRELHIPCVIGTKIATKVLKDGDLVEVDADNGVVRIIKRNEKN